MKQFKITFYNGDFMTSILVWSENEETAIQEFHDLYSFEPLSVEFTGQYK